VTPLLDNVIGLSPGLRKGDDVISKISDKFSSGDVGTGTCCFELVLKNSDKFPYDICRFSVIISLNKHILTITIPN